MGNRSTDLLQGVNELRTVIRAFFVGRGFLEVVTPLVDSEIIPEQHIDPYPVADLGLLQASPEMHHKRLLCEGSGPIFEFSKCFRAGENGKLHRPEFTMVEWYRPGDDLHTAIDLTADLVEQVLSQSIVSRTTYRDAFVKHLGFDPHEATIEQLRGDCQQLAGVRDRDECLNYWMATKVEPNLGKNGFEVLYHFPASQSALARLAVDERGTTVAERFELFYHGIELANGYHELTDAVELAERLRIANEQRVERGAERLPLPERLLAAMTSPGLPDCAGVALGFERLAMIVLGVDSIEELP